MLKRLKKVRKLKDFRKNMGKTIGLTFDLKEDWIFQEGDPSDANAELDRPATIDRIQKAFEQYGHKVKRIGNLQQLLKQIHKLDVDIVFNICEGKRGRNRESEVPAMLEAYRIPFVGSDALTLGITLDKIAAKKMFIADGVPTPGYFNATHADDLDGLKNVKFPLIVKTRHEGTSKGITKNSRVENIKDLKRQIEIITRDYKQPALVEEFIKGTEFTVAVLGNGINAQAMPISQICVDGKANLGNEFYSTERILLPDTIRYECPANISKSLTKKLQEVAVKAYCSTDCRDFGRVDFRVDEKENPYVLEINPLPSLAAADVFSLFPPAIHSTFEEVLNRILGFALERYGMKNANASVLVGAR